MRTVIRTTPILVFLLLFSTHAFSQWEEGQINVFFSVPEIALVDIESITSNNINFTIIPSNESGGTPEIKESNNESLWINYSSAMKNLKSSRSIVAEISNGNLPEGIQLFLKASDYSGRGKGKLGHPTEKINLSSQPKPIITEIGSCFTGDGVNNGHQLSFSIAVTDYSKMRSTQELDFTVLYTITDN
jgi:hypothetical protein